MDLQLWISNKPIEIVAIDWLNVELEISYLTICTLSLPFLGKELLCILGRGGNLENFGIFLILSYYYFIQGKSLFYQIEPLKSKPFLVLPLSLSRDSKEPYKQKQFLNACEGFLRQSLKGASNKGICPQNRKFKFHTGLQNCHLGNFSERAVMAKPCQYWPSFFFNTCKHFAQYDFVQIVRRNAKNLFVQGSYESLALERPEGKNQSFMVK